jgi:hypothetical protein
MALVVIAMLPAVAPVTTAGPADEGTPAMVRVGTFDSRAVALAYYRSATFMAHIKDLKAEHAAAQAAGDDERAAALEAEGQHSQEMAHKQGFGTWPVDDILVHMADAIPQIAADAGVDVIVSKWDLVHVAPGADFVDVTVAMVQPFDPSEATLALIRDELPKVDPIPLAELEQHEH